MEALADVPSISGQNNNTGEIELSGFHGQQRKRRDRKPNDRYDFDTIRGNYDEDSEKIITSQSEHKRRKPNFDWNFDSDEGSWPSPTDDGDHSDDNIDPIVWNTHEDIEDWVSGTQCSVDVPDSVFEVDLPLFHSQFMEMETQFEGNAHWVYEDYLLTDPLDPDESILHNPENSPLLDWDSQASLKIQPSGEEDTAMYYGMIHNVRVKVLPRTVELLKAMEAAQVTFEERHPLSLYCFVISREAENDSYFLKLPKVAGQDIGATYNIAVLNRDAGNTLSEIASLCTFEAYSSPEPWVPIIDQTTIIDKSTCILVDIILYGLPMHCLELGEILTSKKVYLQEPDYWRPGVKYQNLHFLDLSEVHPDLDAIGGPSKSSIWQVDPSFQIEPPENSAAVETLLKQKITMAFKSTTRAENLKRIAAEIRISTPLKLYQEQALDFIKQREYGPIPEKYSLWKWKSSIDGTLVVVPTPLLINEWKQEIHLHCTGFSSIRIYHNQGRTGDARILSDSDIVLSTYHTISHESSDKTSPLWKINWFRIILDEAHIIRRMTTKLFKAMKKLHANSRWCLTGTPVQNSLEDLAALVSFIRSSPLDDLQKFRSHIISPLIRGSESCVENLSRLLDSICLRRTKQLLNLPDVVSETRLLNLSAKEKQQYENTRDKLIGMMKKNKFHPENKKGNLGVFQLQLQLRRLCNHGTFQKLSLDAEDFDPEQAISLLKKNEEATCEGCHVKISALLGIGLQTKRSGSFTVCGHLLCMKCIPSLRQALHKIDGQNDCFQCSLCLATIQGQYFIIDEAVAQNKKAGTKRRSPWQYFDKNGCSTKVSAVVRDLEEHKTDGKSIIFSCWTRSLDLIGIFLRNRKIPFVRIDGTHSHGQRHAILETYQMDSEIKALLMTTGTGAFGLNLTVANCVYLLEPQWNPMVESQAIGRVIRLGQQRTVRVVRYIMKGTVEEVEMQSQQKRKIEYSKVGWNEGLCAEKHTPTQNDAEQMEL